MTQWTAREIAAWMEGELDFADKYPGLASADLAEPDVDSLAGHAVSNLNVGWDRSRLRDVATVALTAFRRRKQGGKPWPE